MREKYSDRTMENTKLSKLQKFILREAYRRYEIKNADVLIRWYGFQSAPRGSHNFNRMQVGIKRYVSATAATAKAITRLRKRGLMTRGKLNRGHTLTRAGRDAAQQILNG